MDHELLPESIEVSKIQFPSIAVMGEPSKSIDDETSDSLGFTQGGQPTIDSKCNSPPPGIDTMAFPTPSSKCQNNQPDVPTDVSEPTLQPNKWLSEVLTSSIQKIVLTGVRTLRFVNWNSRPKLRLRQISSTQLFTDEESAIVEGVPPKLRKAKPYITVPRLSIDGKFNNRREWDGCDRARPFMSKHSQYKLMALGSIWNPIQVFGMSGF